MDQIVVFIFTGNLQRHTAYRNTAENPERRCCIRFVRHLFHLCPCPVFYIFENLFGIFCFVHYWRM